MCKIMGSHAEPKFDGSEFYSKMCAVLKLPKLCYPYLVGSYSYSYPLYPLPPFPPPVLPIAPFPLILSPTSPNPQFTIPTVYTTKNPSSQNGGNMQPMIPNGGPPNGGSNCPPIGICPPAALNVPIDPRQGIL